MSSALPLLQGILRTGVCIVTINPERVYTEASVDDLGALIEIIVVLARAYEESAMKSERLSAAWANKRGSADKKKLTRICPQWLQLSGDRTEFEPIPERVEVVQRIFRMAADGMGANGIAKQLNAEQVPTFGRAEYWQISYIKKVLANRAVLGEYQPHRMQNGKRTAVGDPIPDYYPAIVDESLFYAVQRGTDQRKTQPGRHGKCVTNLFTGLLKDARDGTNLGVVDKGNGPCLVSAAAKSGKRGAVYLSFPYEPFERSLLVWGYDLELGDVLPKQASNLEEELRKAEGKVTDLQHRIATVQEKLGTAGNLDVLLDSLVRLEQQRNEAQQRVERLKQERATQAVAALDRTRELIDRLQAAEEEEVYGLRIKLRSAIKRFVKDIVVLVIQVNHDRVALADVELDNGKRRQVVVMSDKPVELPEGLRRLDIRDWATVAGGIQADTLRGGHGGSTPDDGTGRCGPVEIRDRKAAGGLPDAREPHTPPVGANQARKETSGQRAADDLASPRPWLGEAASRQALLYRRRTAETDVSPNGQAARRGGHMEGG